MIRFAFAFLFGAIAVSAHDAGWSTASVDLSSREILVQVAFAPSDLAARRGAPWDELATQCVALESARRRLVPRYSETRTVGADNVEFTLRFLRPTGGEVAFRAALFDRLPFGHRQVLTVRDEAGTTLATELLSADHPFVTLPIAAAPCVASPIRARIAFAASLIVGAVLGWRIYPRRRVMAAA